MFDYTDKKQLTNVKETLADVLHERGFQEVEVNFIFGGRGSFPSGSSEMWSGTANSSLVFEIEAHYSAFEESTPKTLEYWQNELDKAQKRTEVVMTNIQELQGSEITKAYAG